MTWDAKRFLQECLALPMILFVVFLGLVIAVVTFICRWWVQCLIFLILVILLRIAMQPVYAHDWYPRECCALEDCEPLPEGSVRLESQGYRLPNGQLVRYGSQRTSPDGRYHWCWYPMMDGNQNRTQQLRRKDSPKACFWAPEGQS